MNIFLDCCFGVIHKTLSNRKSLQGDKRFSCIISGINFELRYFRGKRAFKMSFNPVPRGGVTRKSNFSTIFQYCLIT